MSKQSWYVHTVLFSDKKEALTHATTKRNLENIVIIERIQLFCHERPHIVRFHLNKISRIGKSVGTESRFGISRVWKKGK